MLYAVHALDHAGATDARVRAFDVHVDQLNDAPQQGITIVVAGPLMDSATGRAIGSLLLLETDSEKKVREFISNNAFSTCGVWETINITAFKPARGVPLESRNH